MEKTASSQDVGSETRREPTQDSIQEPINDTNDRLALEQQHEQLERQLAILDRHLSLTPDEQIEQRRLKKEKLRVKDQLYRLMPAAARES